MKNEAGGTKMTEMQEKLLEILKWFHELCEKEGLVYYAQGGTALGAVRHNGFIPWDDDLDVGMPRKDYESLKKLSEKVNGNSPYQIEFPGDDREFVYPFCKVYDTKTTLIENTRYKTKRGIYIDVFPIDGIGNTMEESVKNFKRVDHKRNLLCTQICGLRKGRKWYKNLSVILLRNIPFWNSVKMIKDIDRMSKLYDYDKCQYVANLCGNWHEKEIMDKEWVEKPVLCKFEDTQIYIPENHDGYLTRMYGDYMQLPPVEKRVTHHDFISIDLNKSYLEE